MHAPVIIVEYDPRWPQIYLEEKKRVLGILGERALSIEHIGSTAVPGLGAKPIIDMMVGVRDEETGDECQRLLYDAGYTDVTPEPQESDWYYCLGKGPHSFGFHLHLVRHGSGHWERHLVFRDYLREHPETAQEYYELKKGLSEEHGTERLAYTEAKTNFIISILAKPKEEK